MLALVALLLFQAQALAPMSPTPSLANLVDPHIHNRVWVGSEGSRLGYTVHCKDRSLTALQDHRSGRHYEVVGEITYPEPASGLDEAVSLVCNHAKARR